MALVHWYSLRPDEEAERKRRLRVLFVAMISAAGAVFLLHCVSLCALDRDCRIGVDLNCTGSNPQIYEGAALCLVVVSLATIVSEAAYRVARWRATRSP